MNIFYGQHAFLIEHISIISLTVVLMIFNVFDVLLTTHILAKGGYELNPLARGLMQICLSRPWVGLTLLKLIMFAALHYCFAAMDKSKWMWMLIALNFVYGYVVIHNINVSDELENTSRGKP